MKLSVKTKKFILKLFPIIGAFLFGAIVAVLVFQIIDIEKDQKINKPTNQQIKKLVKQEREKETPKKVRAIDGVLIDESEEDAYPMAVTIENNEKARPQSGLDQANLVIEAPVEGGITRFLAIFADNQEVKSIGPIRSARSYFLDWAQEFDALYSHVGGSPEALKTIKNNYQIYNLNQYFQSKYYCFKNLKFLPGYWASSHSSSSIRRS